MAPVAKGSFTPVVGLGSTLFSGCVVEEAELDSLAEVDTIKDEDNATVCRIYFEPGVGGRLNLLVGSSGLAAVEALAVGDVLTIDTVAYYVDSAKKTRSRNTMKAQIAFSARASETPA